MGKIIDFKHVETLIRKLKEESKKIILVGGCFDILHDAHREYLQKSKDLGDILIVILESDESISRRKGKNRPIYTQKERAKKLSDLDYVGYVVCIPHFASDTEYFELVKKLKPDIIALTQNDPIKDKKRAQADLVGGKIVEVMERKEEYSTSKMIENLSKP